MQSRIIHEPKLGSAQTTGDFGTHKIIERRRSKSNQAWNSGRTIELMTGIKRTPKRRGFIILQGKLLKL